MPDTASRRDPAWSPAVPPRRRWSTLGWAAAIGLIVVVALAGYVRWIAPGEPRYGSSRVVCAANLRQIGNAILLYASRHRGALPDSLVTLLHAGVVEPNALVCPLGQTSTPTPRVVALAPASEATYLYVGDRLHLDTLSERDVVALDRVMTHMNEEVSVLFGDGHVEFRSTRGPSDSAAVAQWASVQDQIARGVRPVRWPGK